MNKSQQSRLDLACQGKSESAGGMNLHELLSLAHDRGYNGDTTRANVIAFLCHQRRDAPAASAATKTELDSADIIAIAEVYGYSGPHRKDLALKYLSEAGFDLTCTSKNASMDKPQRQQRSDAARASQRPEAVSEIVSIAQAFGYSGPNDPEPAMEFLMQAGIEPACTSRGKQSQHMQELLQTWYARTFPDTEYHIKTKIRQKIEPTIAPDGNPVNYSIAYVGDYQVTRISDGLPSGSIVEAVVSLAQVADQPQTFCFNIARLYNHTRDLPTKMQRIGMLFVLYVFDHLYTKVPDNMKPANIEQLDIMLHVSGDSETLAAYYADYGFRQIRSRGILEGRLIMRANYGELRTTVLRMARLL